MTFTEDPHRPGGFSCEVARPVLDDAGWEPRRLYFQIWPYRRISGNFVVFLNHQAQGYADTLDEAKALCEQRLAQEIAEAMEA